VPGHLHRRTALQIFLRVLVEGHLAALERQHRKRNIAICELTESHYDRTAEQSQDEILIWLSPRALSQL
jgi:hypothetical protein